MSTEHNVWASTSAWSPGSATPARCRWTGCDGRCRKRSSLRRGHDGELGQRCSCTALRSSRYGPARLSVQPSAPQTEPLGGRRRRCRPRRQPPRAQGLSDAVPCRRSGDRRGASPPVRVDRPGTSRGGAPADLAGRGLGDRFVMLGYHDDPRRGARGVDVFTLTLAARGTTDQPARGDGARRCRRSSRRSGERRGRHGRRRRRPGGAGVSPALLPLPTSVSPGSRPTTPLGAGAAVAGRASTSPARQNGSRRGTAILGSARICAERVSGGSA